MGVGGTLTRFDAGPAAGGRSRGDTAASMKARVWFGATALVVLVGLVLRIALLVSDGTQGAFDSTTDRVFNLFCFFTIQSNIIVGVTSLLLAQDPTRSSTAFRTFRLTGLVCIAVTGIVYHSLLSGLTDLHGLELGADHLLHTVSPIMAVIGWLVFGPRRLTASRIVLLSLIFPVCWLVFALIRGEVIDYYPYPFLDVNDVGYGRVFLNTLGISALYIGLAAGATALDGRLDRARVVREPVG